MQKTPTNLGDQYLQGIKALGKIYACVRMCQHFEQKGYVQHTLLLCSTAGDNETDQKGTIYVNLKTLNADNICTNNHQFEKACVQVQEGESGLERV